ncbi:MAG: hypothetical protein ACI9XB_004674 [Gammaproteobacteria bacterium]
MYFVFIYLNIIFKIQIQIVHISFIIPTYKMKILNILNNLHSNQMQSFNLFMESPFFSITEEQGQLYKILKPYLRKEILDSLVQKEIYTSYITRYKPLTSAQFNKMTFKFRELIEQFLAYDAFSKNEQQKSLALLESYSSFADSRHYKKAHQQHINLLEKSPERGESYYGQLARLKSDLYFHSSYSKDTTDAGALIYSAQEELDSSYILSKLLLATELTYRTKNSKEKHDVSLLKLVIEEAKKKKFPIFDFFLGLIELQKEKPPKDLFTELKEWFIEHIVLIDQKNKGTILAMLLNYANKQYQKGDSGYLIALFDLNKLGVKHLLFLDHSGKMSEAAFTNIVITCCLCKEFGYAHHYLKINHNYLSPNSRENTVNFCMAYIYFHSGHYEKAWAQLIGTKFTTINYKIRSRALLVRCIYEGIPFDKKLEEKLTTELQNFRKYIYRMSSFYNGLKPRYYNMITVIRALKNYDNRYEDGSVFYERWTLFISENSIVAKDWLLKKIEEKIKTKDTSE